MDQAANTAWVATVVDCLRGRGWDAVTTEDSPGDVGFKLRSTVPHSQFEAWNRDMTVSCPKIVGQAPQAPALSRAVVSQVYDFYLDQRACLMAAGYSISEPPSRETFISDYQRGDSWSPYASLPQLTPMARLTVEKQCPQEPTE